MKVVKVLAVCAVLAAVLLAGVVAVALMPSVQTWAVRRAIAGQPGMTLEVGRVEAGFSAASISELRFAQEGVVVTAKGVSAKYTAWDYLANKRINADSVVVQDLVVDLRSPAKPVAATGTTALGASPASGSAAPSSPPARPTTPPTAPTKATPFEGLLQAAQLPLDLRVASLIANGRALLPDGQTVVFDLKGESLETGQSGKLSWTIDFADAKADAALRALRTTGVAGVRIAADRSVTLVEVDAVAAAMGPKLPPDRVKLTLKAEKSAQGDTEDYSAAVSLLRGATVEPLVTAKAQFQPLKRELTGGWEIAVKSEQLAALLAGLGLPEIAATGTGQFQLKTDSNAIGASGELQVRVSQLQLLAPALEAIGAVQLKTKYAGGLSANVARLDQLSLEVTAADGRNFAQISTLQRVSYGLDDQKITLVDPKAELARVSLQQLPLAWAQPAVKPLSIESGDLSVVIALEAEPDGSRVRARAVEPLSVRTLTVRDAQKKALVENVSLSTRPSVDYSATRLLAQLAELRITMPTGDAVSGTVSADVTNLATTPAVAFSAQLQAKIVEALKPYLSVDTGPLAANLAVEGRHSGQTLHLGKASVAVHRAGGPLLASVDLAQAVNADLAKTTFAVANPAAVAARVRLGEIPLAWAEPFVAQSKLAGTLAGGALDVTLRSADDATLSTTEPFLLRGVSVALEGKPMVQTLDLSADLSATKRGDTLAYDVRRLEVKQGEVSLAAFSASGEAGLAGKTPNLAAKGTLEADVAALLRQPALAASATLSRGRVTATFDARVTDAIQAKATLAGRNLVAKQGNRVLGDLDLALTANVKPDGSGTISLPVTLTNAARKSDIAIDGTFGKGQKKDTYLFTGKIASAQLVVEDFEPLAGLAPAGEKPKSPTPAKPTRDTVPFWSGVNGKLEVDLKRVLYGADYVVSGVRGTAVITDSKLSLDGLEGRFKENPFKLSGGVTFQPQQPKPYSLTASADVQGLDIGEILRAANPAEKPALETKATLVARLNGTGATLGDLALGTHGKFDLTGTKGVMRALARKGQAGAAVNIASFGLAVLGAARGSDTTMAIAELTRALNEVAFDSVKLQVERGADLAFKLTSLELVSPILRMTGTGSLAAKDPAEIQNAPMNITLQLGAKDELAHLLNRVGMLGGNTDERGYYLMARNFAIGGTPSKPDNSALWKILLEAGLGALAR